MNRPEFTLELSSEDLPQVAEYKLYVQAEERLRRLATDHNDMVGAAVNVRRPASGETAFLHEVTVVIYGRPEHIAATEKDASAAQALKGALDAAERQIRERRKKLKERWKQPGNRPAEQEIGAVYIAEEEGVNEDIAEIEDELDET